ncbi:MAG TPA: hypothetical protein PLB01_20020, partial [Thermoanaerobaculia bacterium]|nr:hypothetical protein [Thermoanaerobaculia bacterium]
MLVTSETLEDARPFTRARDAGAEARAAASLRALLSALKDAAGDAWAGAALGANPIQLLDRVEVVSPTAVLDMSFKDPGQTPQFDYPPGATG